MSEAPSDAGSATTTQPYQRGLTLRRLWIQRVLALLSLAFGSMRSVAGWAAPAATESPSKRPQDVARWVLPADPNWPATAEWTRLNAAVGGALIKIDSPFEACRADPDTAACDALFQTPANPWAIGDNVALTQTYAWVGAWKSSPSVYAVAASKAADVVAAVNFARMRRVRLVVKGGGHSYQGTSNAADSLLLWTRRMNDVVLHDTFVPTGCAGRIAAQRAVSCGAGAVWADLYDAVTTRGGGYVQGGGCTTVGVAGLVQSGGFGSFSKAFGTAAGNLLEAQVVTADGQLRIANALTHPDLFWAIKGGGGGNFGVVTRLTLRVHPLPETFGAVNLSVKAASAGAFQRLIALTLDFCTAALVGPHWGEQIRLRPDNTLQVSMVFQGLSRSQAVAVWQPFFDVIDSGGGDYALAFSPLRIVATDARNFWAATFFKRSLGFIKRDDRPGAPPSHVFWPGDQAQAGQVLYGYESLWLPAALLQPEQRADLAAALFAATRHWSLSLHLNKGLAGAPAEALQAARDTAMNPAVLDAFALAIVGAHGGPAYPGIRGHEPDEAKALRQAKAIERAAAELRRVVPNGGSYLAESNYYQPDWPRAFWGPNAARLAAAKAAFDPEDLFVTHHGPIEDT